MTSGAGEPPEELFSSGSADLAARLARPDLAPRLARPDVTQARFYKSSVFIFRAVTDRTGEGGLVSEEQIIIVLDDKAPSKGTVITSLSAFQLTPGEGIMGNHPCNVVPLTL